MRNKHGIKKRMTIILCLLLGIQLFYVAQPAKANDSLFDCLQDEEKCIEDKDEKAPTENDSSVQNERSQVGLTAWDYIKTFFALIFVVGLLLFLLKWINQKNRHVQKNRMMQNLGGLSLGQQRSVQLVLIGKTYYILGVGEDIQLLKEVTDAEEIELLLRMVEQETQSPMVSPIEKYFQEIKARLKGQNKSNQETEEPFAKLFQHQLNDLKEERQQQLERLSKKEQHKDD
ncbi:MAG TPA: flagellar biosynthetic protein FliO [Sporosarcina sp.]|nr:flagellar biosynthetic protein FliO [Sporosarcina sp.]